MSDNATFKVEKQSFTSRVEAGVKEAATVALNKGSAFAKAAGGWLKGKMDARKQKQEEEKAAKAAAEEESKKPYMQQPPAQAPP